MGRFQGRNDGRRPSARSGVHGQSGVRLDIPDSLGDVFRDNVCEDDAYKYVAFYNYLCQCCIFGVDA